jgi:pimeloyl-ACP methyl ester carboxylesterase
MCTMTDTQPVGREYPPLNAQTSDRWYAGGQYFAWNGHRIFVRMSNNPDAEPLMLLHGFPTSSFDWLPMWEELTQRFHVMAFDYLGFGLSDKPRGIRYTLHGQADLAQALAEQFFGRDFHVIAHDYGVTVAQELLARTAEGRGLAILSCMFLNGGLFAQLHRARPIQRLLAGPFGSLFVRLVNRKRFGKSFAAVFGPDTKPSDHELDAYWKIICTNGGDRLQHKLLHYMADRREHASRWNHVVKSPPCAIALTNGLLDPVSGEHLVDYVNQLNSAIPIWRLASIGHYPQTEAPGAVLESYYSFRWTLGGDCEDQEII